MVYGCSIDKPGDMIAGSQEVLVMVVVGDNISGTSSVPKKKKN